MCIVIGKFTTSSVLTCLVLCSSCGPVRDGGTARIHQSWDARFSYDFEKRRLVSINKKRMRGRTWGRDEFGRTDYDRYWSGRPILSQNLLNAHRARVDSKLEERWQVAEGERVARRIEEMENESKGGGKPDDQDKEGDSSKEKDDDFVPPPLLPEGIEPEIPSPNDNGGGPFLPLPEGPDLTEPVPAVPPEIDPEAPSPFAPLPPL